MSATNLSNYLRVIVTYLLFVGVTMAAGYEVLAHNASLSDPLVTFAIAYDSIVLGYHLSTTPPSTTGTK